MELDQQFFSLLMLAIITYGLILLDYSLRYHLVLTHLPLFLCLQCMPHYGSGYQKVPGKKKNYKRDSLYFWFLRHMTYYLLGFMFTLHFYLSISQKNINLFLVLSARSSEKLIRRFWISLFIELVVVGMWKWVCFFNTVSGSRTNITLLCEIEVFNFLWLIWDNYLPKAPTKNNRPPWHP